MSKLTHGEKMCIYRAVDGFPALKDFGVVYASEMDGVLLLRDSALPDGYKTWITLQREILQPEDKPVLKEKKPGIIREMVGMGLSCGSAVLAGTATVLTAGATSVTAGSSLVILAVGYSASVASAAQCGISTGRVFNAIFAPKNYAMLDSTVWVNRASQALDAIALAGGVAASTAMTTGAAVAGVSVGMAPIILGGFVVISGLELLTDENGAKNLYNYVSKLF